MKPTRLVFALVLLPASVATVAAASQPIFDGATLKGWVVEGDRPSFTVENKELTIGGAGSQPNWIHTEREYENFRLHFEYKLAKWAEAAVILRAPRLGRPMQTGVALYLAHDYHPTARLYSTGAVPGVSAPAIATVDSFDAWHAVDLTLEGDHFTAAIDGAAVQGLQLSANAELRYRLKRGFIGFPDLGYKYSLRNLQIEDLGSPTRFVDLIDDALAGWQLRGTGEWRVRDHVLSAWGGDGVFYAPGEFENFEITVLVRTHDRVNSGVFLRGSVDPKASRGFEIQIYSPIDSVYPTGSIYNVERSKLATDYEGKWFLLQVIVEGAGCTVRVDGVTVAETGHLPDSLPRRGRIGLQLHSPNALVEFRELRVRPLG